MLNSTPTAVVEIKTAAVIGTLNAISTMPRVVDSSAAGFMLTGLIGWRY
ncbi:MAG: hypothetical protein ACJ04O_04475 [Cellvibrionales bacterium]|nr:hypothetical protein [Porticoccaceae bacterium]